ncbi:hypothetical protein WQ57_06365 [Mesobacillus campisalis]|uniref:HicA family toxin-antitoxin system n=1 Tax=Mesobacillus campisalis TaxID=1408103 RepID=A0A0M2T2B8_9BACI|nr:hypothetical protein [Mesobacillus campisalis]KKK38965.1 hypothetical protein WQ57_06365 [Mesobacillus campisalis]
MPKDNNEKPVIKNFEVDTVFEDRVHERYAFTFKVKNNEYKGYFHENGIQWHHPHPKQMLGDEQMEAIESKIHYLMRQNGISSEAGIEDLEFKPAFEDRMYERQQFTLKIHGEEYRALLNKGEIQWFHPKPHQKLEDEHVQAIETEIHKKAAEKE